jgi:hypothetical protein
MYKKQNYQAQAQHMCNLCKNHMYRYVLLHTNDGKSYDGIIEHVDEKNVYLAVPLTATDIGNRSDDDLIEQDDDEFSRNEDQNEQRQFLGGYGIPGGYPGYGYPGYGYPGYGYPGYGHPGYVRPRRRRFQRQILPLAALTGLALLPYFF